MQHHWSYLLLPRSAWTPEGAAQCCLILLPSHKPLSSQFMSLPSSSCAFTWLAPPCHSGLRLNVTSPNRRLPCHPISNNSQSPPAKGVSLPSFLLSPACPPWRGQGQAFACPAPGPQETKEWTLERLPHTLPSPESGTHGQPRRNHFLTASQNLCPLASEMGSGRPGEAWMLHS